jgi:hypothetical protein
VSDRLFVIRSVAYEHPKDQIKVPKVLLMPSRGAASFTPSTITMQKREYGSVNPLGFSSARRSTSSVWLKPGRKVVSALCKFGRNQGAKAFAMSELGQNAKYSSRVKIFRFAPNNRHEATAAACPFGAARTGSRQCQLIGGKELHGAIELFAPGSLPNDGKVAPSGVTIRRVAAAGWPGTRRSIWRTSPRYPSPP